MPIHQDNGDTATNLNSTPQSLLQISDFCQSRRRHRRKRPTETETSAPPNVIQHPIQKATNHVIVSLSVLHSVPSHAHVHEDGEEANVDGHVDAPADVDHHATIYTESVELLAALHIFQGQICLLSNGDGDVYVPVMIQLWNKTEGKEEGSISGARHGHGSSRESFPICVPPMIAAAVGLYSYQLSTSDGKDVNVSAHKCTFQL
jgi:hypothetical protein